MSGAQQITDPKVLLEIERSRSLSLWDERNRLTEENKRLRERLEDARKLHDEGLGIWEAENQQLKQQRAAQKAKLSIAREALEWIKEWAGSGIACQGCRTKATEALQRIGENSK